MPKVAQGILKKFGAAVKTERSLRGLTLDQLGFQALGRDNAKGFLSQIEKGKRDIGAATAGKLIRFLELPDDLITAFVEQSSEDEVTTEDTRAAQLLSKTEKEGDPGIGENLLIALAYEYAGTDTTDIRTAHNDLKAALEAAVDMQARAALPDNTGDGVAAVRAEVQRLNNEDGPEAAGDYLDDAITRKSAEMGALLDLGVDQDRIRNDPKGAAQKLLTKLQIEVAADQHFSQLRLVRDEWYERGRDAGLNFDATVALHLAEHETMIANGTNERGTAQNDLGTALKTLGERESGTDRLELAVTAYQAASEEWARDKVPLDWAMTQNNLGAALQTLGERESKTDRLEQAIAAYQAALEERTRDKVPLAWATTQNNLGNALKALGERESGTDRLELAVVAYQAALEELTRDEMSLDWAMTQNNLGNAQRTLGERERGTDRLEQAVTAYQAALEEWTRDKVPLYWATTQNNLGNALKTLGERERGTDRLEQAIAAYEAALEERRRDKVPLDWAMTQNNLGTALKALGERESGTDRLELAVAAYQAALEEWTRDEVPFNWALTQANLAILYLSLWQKDHAACWLDKAQDHALAAQAVFLSADASHYIDKIARLITSINDAKQGGDT